MSSPKTGALPPVSPDALPAHSLWVELATRITSQRLHYRSGNEEAAAKSVSSLFPKVRDLLEKNPQADEFRGFAVGLLNLTMRPYTARWDGWMTEDSVQKDKDGQPVRHFCDEQVRRQFRTELQELQVKLLTAQGQLAKMAGISDASTRTPKPADLGAMPLNPGIGAQVEIKEFEGSASTATINETERAAILKRRRLLAGPSVAGGTLTDVNGLALSGGGIRSATFCLGVLQVLAEKKMLSEFDYLSTVSGGGYLGSFLSCALGSVPTPEEENPPKSGVAQAIRNRFDDVFHRKGSGTESGLIRHLRNNSKYLLNGGLRAKLEIVGLVLSGILWNVLMILPIPIVGALLVFLLNSWNVWGAALQPLPATDTWSAQVFWPGGQTVAGRCFFYPALALVVFWPLMPLVQLLTHGRKPGSAGAVTRRVWELTTLGLGVLTCLAAAVCLLPAAFHGYEWIRKSVSSMNIGWLKWLSDWGTASAAGAGSVLLGLLSAWLKPHWPKLRAVAVKLFILSGPLLFFWAFLLVGNRLGLASQGDPGWVSAVPWVAAGLVVWGWGCVNINTLAPHRYYRSKLCECYLTRRARMEQTGAPAAKTPGSGAPRQNESVPCANAPRTRAREFFTGEYVQGRTESLQQIKLTELGASAAAPYHLINTTLNLPTSDNKELRGRNSDFFVVSKHFCGAPVVGYVPTAQVEEFDPHFDLGTAMAVSGAAASTTMGWKSLPHFRFLMTLFNVRLGYWIRRPGAWTMGRLTEGPGPFYLFREMLGSMNERGRYINLSDGGHIENLATYELLRRKCKFIVCVDAGQEPGMECADLIRLQRYALIDLGIEMGFSLKDVSLQANGFSRAYAILVKIDYTPKREGTVEQPKEVGWMLYMKLALTGTEPPYVSDYRRANPQFPHQSTGDQFYDEAQFEAYRMLGECAAENLFRDEITEGEQPPSIRDWFQQLANKLLPDNDPVFGSPVAGEVPPAAGGSTRGLSPNPESPNRLGN